MAASTETWMEFSTRRRQEGADLKIAGEEWQALKAKGKVPMSTKTKTKTTTVKKGLGLDVSVTVQRTSKSASSERTT